MAKTYFETAIDALRQNDFTTACRFLGYAIEYGSNKEKRQARKILEETPQLERYKEIPRNTNDTIVDEIITKATRLANKAATGELKKEISKKGKYLAEEFIDEVKSNPIGCIKIACRMWKIFGG
ncbi:MAG: hypothetical protein IJN19_03485 [Opitutales bacterium]|nr:hypothetical protein [Opitutales bacterium]